MPAASRVFTWPGRQCLAKIPNCRAILNQDSPQQAPVYAAAKTLHAVDYDDGYQLSVAVAQLLVAVDIYDGRAHPSLPDERDGVVAEMAIRPAVDDDFVRAAHEQSLARTAGPRRIARCGIFRQTPLPDLSLLVSSRHLCYFQGIDRAHSEASEGRSSLLLVSAAGL